MSPPTELDVKLPPQDLDSEQGVLGACLLSYTAVDHALPKLEPKDFYREAHQVIFQAMVDISASDEPVDIITVSAKLRRQRKLEGVGGGEYLTALIGHVPSAAHVGRYAEEVLRCSIARQAIHVASELDNAAYNNPDDVAELLGATTSKLDLLQERCEDGTEPIPTSLSAADDLLHIEERMTRDYEVSVARWGIEDLDRITGGLEDVGYMVLKGATNAGKSSLLCQIILATARAIGDGAEQVVMFGMEERSWRWMQRSVAWLGKFSPAVLQNRPRWQRAKERDALEERANTLEERFWDGVAEYAALPILRASGPQSLGSLEAHCKRLLRQAKPVLVVVDYLQLLGKNEYDTEEQAFREVAQRMTRLRDLLACPIVAASQVTKGGDGSEYTFGAKAFEHNADFVTRISRKRNEDEQWEEFGALVCEKSREVASFGKFDVHTNFKTGRWTAVATDEQEEQAKAAGAKPKQRQFANN